MILKIHGGNKLKGTVIPIPNKNSIVAALPASILVKGKTVFKNVPKSPDVDKILNILKDLGAKIDNKDYGNLIIDCKNIKKYEINLPEARKFRGSIMFAGPLLARFGKAKIPIPGGCTLGKRSIAAHIDIFRQCGAKITYNTDNIYLEIPKKLKKVKIWQQEASVTATENFIIYASSLDGQYELIDSACEPHVVDLINFMKSMGADIQGKGSNILKIRGKKTLKTAAFYPCPDPIDIIGYITAAALTKGNITIKNAGNPDIVDGIINNFQKFNIDIKKSKNDLLVNGAGQVTIDIHNSGIPLAAEDLPKFSPRPWPGFPVDGLPQIAALSCKLNGRILIQNWMYESGLEFCRELNSMGANIFICDPQRVIVTGPCKLKDSEVFPPEVIQAIMAIFLLALADNVQTTIHKAEFLLRRYPDLIENYRKLGADIVVEDKIRV